MKCVGVSTIKAYVYVAELIIETYSIVNLLAMEYLVCFHPHLSGRIPAAETGKFDPTGEDGNRLNI